MEVEVLRSLGERHDLHAEWDELHAACPSSSLFNSYRWVTAWFQAFGSNKSMRVFLIREAGKLVGIAPFTKTSVRRRPWFSMHHIQPEDLTFIRRTHRLGCLFPVKQLSVFGNLQSGTIRGGWFFRPGLGERVAEAVLRALRNENDWQVLCLPGVKQEDAPQVMRAAHVSGLRVGSIPGICTLYSQPVSPWEEYFAARTGHFRKRFKAAERALDALGVVRFETITDEKRLPNVLEEVFDLAKASWKETAQKTSDVHLPLTEEARTFYRALSAAYAAIEGCQVVTIRIEGALLAAMLSIVADDRLYLLQTYYAPAVAGASPGRFLIREVIKWAAHHGIAWIDMNGNSGLVKMFADTAQTYDQFFIFRSDRYPNWLHRVGSVVERLRGAPAHTA